MPWGKLEPLRSSSSGKSGRTSSTRGEMELILSAKRWGKMRRTTFRNARDQRDLGRMNTLPCILRWVTAGKKAAMARRVARLSQNLIDSLRTEVPSTSCRSVGRSVEKRKRSPSVSRQSFEQSGPRAALTARTKERWETERCFRLGSEPCCRVTLYAQDHVRFSMVGCTSRNLCAYWYVSKVQPQPRLSSMREGNRQSFSMEAMSEV